MSQPDLSKKTTTGPPPGRKRLRLVLLALLSTAGLLAIVLYWPPERGGFATPQECAEAYGAASKSGSVEPYLRCLAEPLRARTRQHFPEPDRLAEALRHDMDGVKAWVVASAPAVEGSTAQVDVDAVREDGVRRLHFRLERSGGGWLIAGVSSPQARPAAVPYGTHVKNTDRGTAAEPAEEKEAAEDR